MLKHNISLFTGIMFFTLLISCNGVSPIQEKLVHIDSLLTQDQDSIAWIAIKNFDVSNLDNEKMAYYNLLKVRTMYKLYMPIKNDSIIDLCIKHFERTGNNKKLAEAYYYKSAIYNDRCDVKNAIIFMKTAEKIISQIEDEELKFKIYEKLSFYNSNEGEYGLSISYSNKSLNAAIKTGNNNYIAYAYTYLALAHMWNENLDSANFYLNKCIPFFKYIKSQDQAYLYDIIGELYKRGGKKQAKEFLIKAIQRHPLEWTYKRLAELYLEEGNEKEANKIWEKALVFSTKKAVLALETKIGILEDMRELKRKYGYHKEADSLAGLIIALKDSAKIRKEQQAIKETQENYDEEQKDRAAENRQRTMAVVIILTAIAGAAATAIYNNRHRKDKRRIDDGNRREAEYMRKIDELDKNKRKAETQLRKANTQKERQAELIAEG